MKPRNKSLFALIFVFIVLVFFLRTVHGAVPSYRLNISISNDTGITWFEPNLTNDYNTWICKPQCFDSSLPFGFSNDLWNVNNWSREELNESNFKVRITYESIVGGSGTPKVDSIFVIVYYTITSFEVNFSLPTPENNTYIGGTLFLNATTSEIIESCKVQHNISGSLENLSLEVTGDTSCGGYIYRIYNSTSIGQRISYQIIADSEDVSNQYTVSRSNLVNNTKPFFSMAYPLNFSRNISKQQIFRWEYEDNYSDAYDVYIMLSNDTTTLNHSVHFANNSLFDDGSAKIRFNNHEYPKEGLRALWHFDNDPESGSNTTHFYDIINNSVGIAGSDGELPYLAPQGGGLTTYPSGNPYNADGRLGLYFPAYNTSQNIRLVVNTSSYYNDLCFNGCSVGAWVYVKDFIEVAGFVNRDSWKVSPFPSYFSLGSSSTGTATFTVYSGSGSSPACSVSSTGAHITVGKWYHIVGTFILNDSQYSPNNITRMYVNGQFDNIGACGSFRINQAKWLNATLPIVIGERANGIFNNPLYGLVDEVFLYDRPLSASEIQKMHNLSYQTYYWQACADDGNMVCSPIQEFDLDGCQCPLNQNCVINSSLCKHIKHPLDVGNYNLTFSDNYDVLISERIFRLDLLTLLVGGPALSFTPEAYQETLGT